MCSSLHRGPVGENGERVHFLGLLREKENSYMVSFLGLRGYKNFSLGVMWNFSKEQGSPELISDYGAQRAHS